MAELNDLFVSTLFIAFTCFLAFCGRKLVKLFVKEPFVQALFNEAIATAELCGCCFELVVVADHFGVGTYAIYLFLLTIFWSYQWGDATACPYTHLEDIVNGKSDLRKAFFLIWAQLTGGILVYQYVRFVWSFEIIVTHEDKANEVCTADLKIPVLYGAFVEGIATCICRIASHMLNDSGSRLATIIDSFIGTSLVVLAFDYSGGYFNPVLATALKHGCTGHTFFEHMIVYWVGAIGGSIASVYIYQSGAIQTYMNKEHYKTL